MIETDIEIPAPTQSLLPDLSEKEEVMLRGKTAKLLSELTDKPLVVAQQHRDDAKALLRNEGNIQPVLPKYPNETIAYLAGLVTEYDRMVVNDLAELKLFVVNKLIEESNGKNPKDRITALRALGDIDGIDAFKKRTEITVNEKSTQEIEKELMQKLDNLTIDITPKLNVYPSKTKSDKKQPTFYVSSRKKGDVNSIRESMKGE